MLSKVPLVVLFLFLLNSLIAQNQTDFTFSGKSQKQFALNYILRQPSTSSGKKPLLIFLHGSGEKGSKIEDLSKLTTYGPLKYLATNPIDAFVLAPQCPEQQYWNNESLYALVQEIINQYDVDTSRIYLTGFSMGAWGTWNMAYQYPNLFAAIVPVAGYVDRIPMIEKCKIAHLPTRIFHGLQDSVVDVYYSIKIYNYLKDCNRNIELNILPNVNHDTHKYVYETQEIYDWMLKQRK